MGDSLRRSINHTLQPAIWDSRCYRELRSYLRHTEWQVGISLTFFFHLIYFLDSKFMSDLLHYKWEICIPNMTGQVLIFSKFSINEDRIWHFQQRILQNINVFSKILKESTSFYHIQGKYSFFYLPVQRELEVLCSKNIIRNFIPMVKMIWLSGTADRAITYIKSVELNGNREHENN